MPFEAFNKNAKRNDGLQGYCRECWKVYYKETYYHGGKEKARLLKKSSDNRLAAQELIKSAKDKPCADCGLKYPPYVMDFDHLSDKSFNIGRHEGRSLNVLQIEIDKCEVVCANCHRERTWQRKQTPVV